MTMQRLTFKGLLWNAMAVLYRSFTVQCTVVVLYCFITTMYEKKTYLYGTKFRYIIHNFSLLNGIVHVLIRSSIIPNHFSNVLNGNSHV